MNRVKIRAIIKAMKNDSAPGPDRITIKFIKTFIDELIIPIESICKDSIDKGKFPSIWKLAHITPVKKSGKNKGKAESFRPVALTCILGKVLESVVKQDIQELLETHCKLSSNQHGF